MNGKTKSKTYYQKYWLFSNIIMEWDINFYKRHLIFVKQDEKYQVSFTRGHWTLYIRGAYGFAYLFKHDFWSARPRTGAKFSILYQRPVCLKFEVINKKKHCLAIALGNNWSHFLIFKVKALYQGFPTFFQLRTTKSH